MSDDRMSPVALAPRMPFVAQLGLLMGPFLSMVDSNVVNVALAPIAQSLHGSLHDTQWIVSGYLLALSAALTAAAYLAKRFSTMRVYRVSLVGFLLGSVLCALSPTLPLLIAARVFQGAFGALLIPLAMTMILGTGGRMASGEMSPLLGIVLFMAPAIGPSLGGLLIQASGWPLIFLINIPFGIFGLIAGSRIKGSTADAADRSVRFDPVGILMLSLGVVGVTYGATNGPTEGWLSLQSLPFWAAGAALVALYAILRRTWPHPAVNLSLLKVPITAAAVGIATLTSVVNFAMVVLVPLFMQSLQHVSALVTGFALIPQALMSGVGTVVSNRITRRFGVWATSIARMILLTAGHLVPAPDRSLAHRRWVIACVLVARAFAIGLVVQPLIGDGCRPDSARGDRGCEHSLHDHQPHRRGRRDRHARHLFPGSGPGIGACARHGGRRERIPRDGDHPHGTCRSRTSPGDLHAAGKETKRRMITPLVAPPCLHFALYRHS